MTLNSAFPCIYRRDKKGGEEGPNQLVCVSKRVYVMQRSREI